MAAIRRRSAAHLIAALVLLAVSVVGLTSCSGGSASATATSRAGPEFTPDATLDAIARDLRDWPTPSPCEWSSDAKAFEPGFGPGSADFTRVDHALLPARPVGFRELESFSSAEAYLGWRVLRSGGNRFALDPQRSGVIDPVIRLMGRLGPPGLILSYAVLARGFALDFSQAPQAFSGRPSAEETIAGFRVRLSSWDNAVGAEFATGESHCGRPIVAAVFGYGYTLDDLREFIQSLSFAGRDMP